jgi:predicted dehydrogenase
MRVALLEVSHWHVAQYLAPLEVAGIEIVGVSDGENVKGPDVAARIGCALYASYGELLERERVEFAFAFGRHAEMPRIAESLLQRRIPFAIEKPCGVRAGDVGRLRRLAEAAKVYVAVPYIFRLSDLLAEIRALEGRIPSDFDHMSFRFMAGPPSRYRAAGAAWMLDPKVSGGGSTINLGVHFIDLFRLLTGKDVRTVSGHMNSRLHGAAVEDYSLVTMTTDDGVIGVVETGYTFPSAPEEPREFSFTLSSRNHYIRSGPESIVARSRAAPNRGSESRSVRLNTSVYYPVFVERVLADYRAGKPPIAGLREAEAVMQIVDAAYASARNGGALQTLPRDAA